MLKLAWATLPKEVQAAVDAQDVSPIALAAPRLFPIAEAIVWAAVWGSVGGLSGGPGS